ncbi:recombinase family protein, partial [Hoeflea sp.]|uniref:recombinase family protein n=1 Tax=Hoeflea sp. TaxID=1940281 RepID=UPI002AFEBD2C
MIKAYSYIRFSTPAQAQGDSLRRQIAKAEAWANERGLILDNTLRDLGVSAFHGANRTKGALRAFLDMVESGQVGAGSYLIVESLDRISREAVIDAAQQLFALIQAKIIVVTLDDNQEYSAERLRNDWTPLIISLAVMSRAHDESRQKSIRVGEVWRIKKEAARGDGKPITSRCPEWLEVQDDKFIPRADRVAVVRSIFDYTIAGYGRREIVRRLNAVPVPTFRGGHGWQTSTIAKIQQSGAVVGKYQPHSGTHRNRDRRPDGDPIEDYYPRIVDDVTYWRAQKAIGDRRKQSSGRRGVGGAHILRGLAKCEECDGPMHIINKGRPPKGGTYLRCSNNRRNAGCGNNRSWRVDLLETAVLKSVGSLDVTA